MSTVAMELNRREKTAAAMVEMCSVRLGTALFGVPITHILEIVGSARPQPVPLAPPFVGGLVHYRGDVLTTASLDASCVYILCICVHLSLPLL